VDMESTEPISAAIGRMNTIMDEMEDLAGM